MTCRGVSLQNFLCRNSPQFVHVGIPRLMTREWARACTGYLGHPFKICPSRRVYYFPFACKRRKAKVKSGVVTIFSCSHETISRDGDACSMGRVLPHFLRLKSFCLDVLHPHFVRWTKPLTLSLPLGTPADLGRSKPQLLAENAFLRKPLIILSRQVKRPAYHKADRMLLVLLARFVRTWKQALFIVQPDTLLGLPT